MGGARSALDRRGLSPPDAGRRTDTHRPSRVGTEWGLGHLEKSSVYGPCGLWEDSARAAAPETAGAAGPSAAATQGHIELRCALPRLDSHPRARRRRARGVRRRAGAVGGNPSPCTAVPTGGPLSAAGLAAMSALWLCLLWQTLESECPQRPTTRLGVLSLCWHGCLSLWRPPSLSQYPGADRSPRAGSVAGSVCPRGTSRTVGAGVYPSPPYGWPGAATGAYRFGASGGQAPPGFGTAHR